MEIVGTRVEASSRTGQRCGNGWPADQRRPDHGEGRPDRPRAGAVCEPPAKQVTCVGGCSKPGAGRAFRGKNLPPTPRAHRFFPAPRPLPPGFEHPFSRLAFFPRPARPEAMATPGRDSRGRSLTRESGVRIKPRPPPPRKPLPRPARAVRMRGRNPRPAQPSRPS
jgi:hypothetical protein